MTDAERAVRGKYLDIADSLGDEIRGGKYAMRHSFPSLTQIMRRFKVSRSLLELRFRELQGESVYEAMLRIRLDEVKRRLRQTNEPISEITAACGWENPAPPKVLFKRRFGISMREYRFEGR